MKTRGIVFDLFNTLVYTKIRKNPYLYFFDSLNLNKEELNYWRNRVMTENFVSFGDLKDAIKKDTDIYTDKFDFDVKMENENTFLYDDAEFVLNELSKRYKLFLISNIATPYKECFYTLKLDRWFKDPIFSCDVGFKKPDSRIYELVVDRSGLHPGKLLMIGDSKKCDVDGPRSCGMQSMLKDRHLKLILNEII